MKNTFIMLLAAVLFCLPALGQSETQIRKVAILETIDREGNISAGVKLLVRSNLARAISNTPGYEGYDRVDVASIMGEQDFQRTGMVNSDQIRKLGEMTGASDILVTEVAMIDASNIIITAKILDVESARLLQTAYVQTNTTPIRLESGCNEVAAQLLGIESGNLPASSAHEQETALDSPSNIVQPEQTIAAKPAITPKERFKPRYFGNVEAGYTFVVGGNRVDLGAYPYYADRNSMSYLNVSTSHGCLILPYLYVGAGVAVNYYHSYQELGLPIFANVRGIYPLKTVDLFLNVKAGYEVLNGGMYSSFAFGVGIRKYEISLGTDLNDDGAGFAMKIGYNF